MRLLILALCAAAGFARADSPDNYAFGVPLIATEDAAFYRVELPPAIYEGVSRADLGDLRVFNGDGAAVPFALLTPAASTMSAGSNIGLPLFPLRTEAATTDLSGLTLTLARTTAGTSLRLATQDGKPVSGERLVGYVLDASDINGPVKAIELTWPPASGSMTRHLKIEASEDLSTWRTVVADAPMIDLEFGGRRLIRNRIDLPTVKARYFRITWNVNQAPLEISTASAEFGDIQVEPARRWRDVAGTAVASHEGDYEFDLGGVFPIDRIAVDLPEINSVVPAQLYARTSADGAWYPSASLIAYRLRGAEQDLKPAPTTIKATATRYWMLRVDPRSGGVGTGVPHLRAGGPAHELIFAARGTGPFIIAYGNATATPAVLPVAMLVPDYGSASAPAIAVATAGTDAPRALGGASRLSRPTNYRRVLLWCVLVLGVAAMAWMAWRLSSQMGAVPSPKQSNAAETPAVKPPPDGESRG